MGLWTGVRGSTGSAHQGGQGSRLLEALSPHTRPGPGQGQHSGPEGSSWKRCGTLPLGCLPENVHQPDLRGKKALMHGVCKYLSSCSHCGCCPGTNPLGMEKRGALVAFAAQTDGRWGHPQGHTGWEMLRPQEVMLFEHLFSLFRVSLISSLIQSSCS